MKRKLLPKIFIALLGAAFISWAAGDLLLGLFGERALAAVTYIRREGGERAETIPNKYTYNISYTFTLPNGNKVDGFTKKIGDAAYLKADGKSRIAVRYFKTMPYINASEENISFSLKQPILAAIGILLIVQMNRRR